MTHKEKSANLNAKCSGGHFEFRKLASAQPPVWPVVATENSRKFPKRRLKRNWEQFLVKKWCFQKSHKICEIFGLLLSTQDLTKAAQSVPIAFPISLFLLYCGSIKLKNKMINKQWYARNGETVGRKKTLLVLAWDADWPYCYIIIQSLAIYSNYNLPSRIKMPKWVQKFAKYKINHPRYCPKTFKLCQSGEILPNLVTQVKILKSPFIQSHFCIKITGQIAY